MPKLRVVESRICGVAADFRLEMQCLCRWIDVSGEDGLGCRVGSVLVVWMEWNWGLEMNGGWGKEILCNWVLGWNDREEVVEYCCEGHGVCYCTYAPCSPYVL